MENKIPCGLLTRQELVFSFHQLHLGISFYNKGEPFECLWTILGNHPPHDFFDKCTPKMMIFENNLNGFLSKTLTFLASLCLWATFELQCCNKFYHLSTFLTNNFMMELKLNTMPTLLISIWDTFFSLGWALKFGAWI